MESANRSMGRLRSQQAPESAKDRTSGLVECATAADANSSAAPDTNTLATLPLVGANGGQRGGGTCLYVRAGRAAGRASQPPAAPTRPPPPSWPRYPLRRRRRPAWWREAQTFLSWPGALSPPPPPQLHRARREVPPRSPHPKGGVAPPPPFRSRPAPTCSPPPRQSKPLRPPFPPAPSPPRPRRGPPGCTRAGGLAPLPGRTAPRLRRCHLPRRRCPR